MWLLYFDHEKHKQLLSFKWKSQLKNELRSHNSNTNETELEDYMRNSTSTSTLTSSKSDNIPWALKYQHLFRNSIKMHVYCVLCALIIGATNITAFYFDENLLFNYVQSSWAFIFATILLIGSYKIQRCRDELNIRRMLI